MVTDTFASHAETLPLYAEWRAKCTTPSDAWLWYRALRLETTLGSPAAAGAAAADPALDPFLPRRGPARARLRGRGRRPAPRAGGAQGPPRGPAHARLPLEAAADLLAEVGRAAVAGVRAPRRPRRGRPRRSAPAAAQPLRDRTRARAAPRHPRARHRLEVVGARDRRGEGVLHHRLRGGETRAPGRFFGLGLRRAHDLRDRHLGLHADAADARGAHAPEEARTTGDEAKLPPRGARPTTTCRGPRSGTGSTSRARCSS